MRRLPPPSSVARDLAIPYLWRHSLATLLMTMFAAAWMAPAPTVSAQTPTEGRVVLVSLDGLGAQTLADDPVAAELTRVRALAARGVQAAGVRPHVPSTTANTHAALWTGAWGDVNGITGNTMPIAPRREHTAFERALGFGSEYLRAEPIWLTAARQGVRAVVQQASQSYPFVAATVGEGLATPPLVLNGYQTRMISPPRVLRAQDVSRVACESGSMPPALACLEWTSGSLTFRGRFEVPTAGGSPHLHVTSPGASQGVDVYPAPVEQEMPRDRPLARHFSDGLLIDNPADPSPLMVYFRLFEVSPDGLEFVLYQAAIHDLALYDGGRDTRADVLQLLREAGGFLGNAAGYEWEREQSALGTPLARGGDGTSERRYLETVEIAVRQSIAHSNWLWRHLAPRLFVVYTSLPDEMDHRFLALSRTDHRYVALRRWGYQLIDRTAGALIDLTSANDSVVLVSDHGLAPVTHEVNVTLALQQAGLLAADGRGRIDEARTQVVPLRNCLIVNSTDWRGGIVPPADRTRVLRRAMDALRGLVDPSTGKRLITELVWRDGERRTLGFGGPNGMDACFGLREGYATGSSLATGALVTKRSLPKGDHNFLSSRPEMQGMLVAAGPRLPHNRRWSALRAIDVAPMVSDLLGIDPPAQAMGRSPIRK